MVVKLTRQAYRAGKWVEEAVYVNPLQVRVVKRPWEDGSEETEVWLGEQFVVCVLETPDEVAKRLEAALDEMLMRFVAALGWLNSQELYVRRAE